MPEQETGLWSLEQEETVPECFYYTCHEPNPRHVILWKCPKGHRTENRYCNDHIDYMMHMVRHKIVGTPMCRECSDTGHIGLLTLVQEG